MLFSSLSNEEIIRTIDLGAYDPGQMEDLLKEACVRIAILSDVVADMHGRREAAPAVEPTPEEPA